MIVSTKTGQTLDEIRLSELGVQCTIGLYPEEAVRTQYLTLSVSLYLDTRQAGRSGRLSQTIDYARLGEELSFLLRASRFRLLETAAEALSQFLLSRSGPDALAPEAVVLSLTKPEALRGYSKPCLTILRRAEELDQQNLADGIWSFQAPDAKLYRIELRPGTALNNAALQLQKIWAYRDGLLIQGRPLASHQDIACHPNDVIQNPEAHSISFLGVRSLREGRLP